MSEDKEVRADVDVNELSIEVLDFLVAQLEGVEVVHGRVMSDIYWTTLDPRYVEESNDPTNWSPTQYWEQGGQIIEREKIDVMWSGDRWSAYCMTPDGEQQLVTEGATPLIAAMRCYVASVAN